MIELAERTDTRRITEADPDYQRLHSHWRRKLLASVKQYARELAASSPEHEHAVQGAFVRRHTRLLSQCYIDGHAEGQRDYWQAVSNKRHTPHDPDRSQLLRRLRFYTPSVVKMAIEGMLAWHETKRRRSHGLSESALFLADTSSMDAWLAGINNRVTLQAEASWMGLQDGYANESGIDPASPYALLYWDLEPLARHCGDCLQLAGDSPYDPPGSGGHELNQTPGDGGTECGAGCKCSLRYGYFDGQRSIGNFKIPPPTPDEPLNDGQKAALDLMRATHNAWQEHAPDLPDLPDMFGEVPEDMPAMDWDAMTPQQQQLYAQWIEALLMWQEAGGEG